MRAKEQRRIVVRLEKNTVRLLLSAPAAGAFASS